MVDIGSPECFADPRRSLCSRTPIAIPGLGSPAMRPLFLPSMIDSRHWRGAPECHDNGNRVERRGRGLGTVMGRVEV